MTYAGVIKSAIVAAVLLIAAAVAFDVDKYTDARDDRYDAAQLAAVQDQLDEALRTVDVVAGRAETVSRSMTVVRGERDVLAKQNEACRYVVRMNDRLVYGMLAQQAATGRLIREDQAGAKRAVDRAGWNIDQVNTIVRNSGYRDLSALVVACSQPQREPQS